MKDDGTKHDVLLEFGDGTQWRPLGMMRSKHAGMLINDDGREIGPSEIRVRQMLARGVKAMVVGGIVKPDDIAVLSITLAGMVRTGGRLRMGDVRQLGEFIPGALRMAAKTDSLAHMCEMIEGGSSVDALEFLSSLAQAMIETGLDAI